jgi:protein-S-isoprenylcysteine O-methyltransferase Ste14
MMSFLELKLPPPLLFLLAVLGMWGLSYGPPHWVLPEHWRIGAAITTALLGLSFSLSGVISFRRARTTISPIHPEHASHLVRTGIYRLTRNPMYVGLVLLLIGLGIYLQSYLALLVLPIFAVCITRFQIKPEERILLQRFGNDYAQYCREVRRWL